MQNPGEDRRWTRPTNILMARGSLGRPSVLWHAQLLGDTPRRAEEGEIGSSHLGEHRGLVMNVHVGVMSDIQNNSHSSSRTMQFTTVFATLAIAFFTQRAHAGPVSSVATDIGKSFPVLDISAVQAHANLTLASSRAPGIHADAAQAEFPATLLLCPTESCISCFGVDLSAIPPNQCLVTDFSFVSATINQPSNEGLPFGVFFSPPGCDEFVQMPEVNTCFNFGELFENYAIN
ncbi:hypothetical protein BD413DRAFT_305524 [Trametes elegans]|nr:hypothetical protein BD413DRAFT_305524 [Trametes elegans]